MTVPSSGYFVRLIPDDADPDPVDDNVDVEVVFESGEFHTATLPRGSFRWRSPVLIVSIRICNHIFVHARREQCPGPAAPLDRNL
jgi:hypothetical protein